MSGLATVRVLLALLWLLLGLWLQSTGLADEKTSSSSHLGTNVTVMTVSEQEEKRGSAVFSSDTTEDSDNFYDYSDFGTDYPEDELDEVFGGTSMPLPPVSDDSSENNKESWTVDYSDETRQQSSDSEAGGHSGYALEKPGEASTFSMSAMPKPTAAQSGEGDELGVATTTAHTKPVWEEENYIHLGLNPKIEVNIKILHEQSIGAPEVKDETETFGKQAGETTTVTPVVVPSETSSASIKNLGLIPFAIRSLDQDLGLSGHQNNNNIDKDVCERWLHCPGEHLLSKLARLEDLPSCPCGYSFDIHYKDEIWDRNKQRYYRWRDASGPNDHVSIFRPGAKWCIRSLISDGSSSMAAQQCCYDHKRQLITRAAGAGTPYVISPEVSRELHHKVDVIPWIMCQGDWTRYHTRRLPNNGLSCRQNPGDKQYYKQMQKAKEYR